MTHLIVMNANAFIEREHKNIYSVLSNKITASLTPLMQDEIREISSDLKSKANKIPVFTLLKEKKMVINDNVITEMEDPDIVAVYLLKEEMIELKKKFFTSRYVKKSRGLTLYGEGVLTHEYVHHLLNHTLKKIVKKISPALSAKSKAFLKTSRGLDFFNEGFADLIAQGMYGLPPFYVKQVVFVERFLRGEFWIK